MTAYEKCYGKQIKQERGLSLIEWGYNMKEEGHRRTHGGDFSAKT